MQARQHWHVHRQRPYLRKRARLPQLAEAALSLPSDRRPTCPRARSAAPASVPPWMKNISTCIASARKVRRWSLDLLLHSAVTWFAAVASGSVARPPTLPPPAPLPPSRPPASPRLAAQRPRSWRSSSATPSSSASCCQRAGELASQPGRRWGGSAGALRCTRHVQVGSAAERRNPH